MDVDKDRNVTASALFGAAAIQILAGLFTWGLYGELLRRFQWPDQLFVLSGGFYVLLGFAARWMRRSAAMVGAALYAILLAHQAFRSIDLLKSGPLFKVPVALLLLVAVGSSLRRPRASPAQPPPPESA